MNPLDLLPTLFVYFEKFCIKIATKKWHKPGFYLSTVFIVPLALYVHRKETRPGLRVLLTILANMLLLLYIFLFLNGFWRFWIFLLLLPVARIIKFFYDHLIGEIQTEPIQWTTTTEEPLFYKPILKHFEKLDLLALLFILFIFLGFLVNADKFSPTGPDCWYHMAVARKIIELGNIPLWDSWEFQPVGRPHLYPPLLHILIALCSKGDVENIIGGARTLQVVLYPAALLTSWYFARLLFSSKTAFIALIILSMDITFSIIFIGLMPSALVNLLFPLILVGFLSKRLILSVPLMVVCLYSHLSFPFLILICLFVLSYKYRTYLSFYKKFLLLSLILYTPWALRVFFFRDFLRSFATITGNPLLGVLLGMLSLQIVSPIFLYCGIQGIRKSSGINRDIIKYILIGFLPALLFYGGRYWFHTAPFWAIFIALYIKKWISSKKRIALLLLFALVPLPMVTLNIPRGGPSIMLSVTALDGVLGLQYWPSSLYQEDITLKQLIEEHTAPDQIIHVDDGSLADKIVTLTGRPVDNGMWFEVGSKEIERAVAYAKLYERPAVFVYINEEELPSVDEVHRIGRYWAALRFD